MSKYFTESELACKCCGQLPANGIDPRLYDALDAIREQVGQPVTVLSGYRCPVHNAEVGGATRSQHLEGTAADLTYDGIDTDRLADIAEQCGADG